MFTCRFKLGIEPLSQRALEDIGCKVSLDNIMPEVLTQVPVGWVLSPSPAIGPISNHILTFPFSQEKITEVWCDLLVSNFRDPKTITLMKEYIGHIFDGSLSHCADTLKLGLRKALNLKKQRIGVKLRCPWKECPRHTAGGNLVLYSSVGSKIYCYSKDIMGREVKGCLQCDGCGWKRTSNSAACQGCGKWFL